MKLNVRILALLLGVFFWACSENQVAGTATDTENTIAGVVHLSDGSSANGVLVRQVVSAHKVSPAVYLETQTDSLGSFVFDSTLADTVNMEFRYRNSDSTLSQAQILRGITAKDAGTLNVKLEQVAVLRGQLEYAGSASNLAGSHFFAFLESTTFFADVFAPDSFALITPEGDYTLTILPADSGVVSKLREKGYSDSTIYRRLQVSLAAGDTLEVGNLRWNATREGYKKEKILRGTVTYLDKPLKGVAVHVVTDLYGFGADSSAFVTQAVTDSNGNWQVLAPAWEAVEDSFRVEFNGKDSLGKPLAGVSEYIAKATLEAASDTISVKSIALTAASGLSGSAFLVVNDPISARQDTLCWAYSIRAGIRGTSHFKTVSSCDRVELSGLPSGVQDLIFYSGDEIVVRNLRAGQFELEDYVRGVNGVNLPEGAVLKQQNFTYTPPTLPKNGTKAEK